MCRFHASACNSNTHLKFAVGESMAWALVVCSSISGIVVSLLVTAGSGFSALRSGFTFTYCAGSWLAGAAQGIGRAWAHALGEAGAAVAVVDMNQGKACEVVQELRNKGIRAAAIQADVSKKDDCDR